MENSFHLFSKKAQHKRTTIALTTPASEWIAKQESTLASLSSPVYLPPIVPPPPWTSLSEGGYLVTPLKLLRQASRRAQQRLGKARPAGGLFGRQCNAEHGYPNMREAWHVDLPLFGFERHSPEQRPPRLPDDANPDQIQERSENARTPSKFG